MGTHLIQLPQKPEPVYSDELFSFAPGIYLMYGPTASGKTGTAVAMAYHMSRDASVAYRNWYEPRGEWPGFDEMTKQKVIDPKTKQVIEEGGAVKMVQAFTTNLLAIPATVTIVDSINVIMYLAPSVFSGLATFKEGLSPAHSIFLGGLSDALLNASNASKKTGRTLIALINKDLFPVKSLEGAVEGAIEVVSPGQLRMRDRLTRKERDITIPQGVMNEAFNALYGADFNPNKNTTPYSYGRKGTF